MFKGKVEEFEELREFTEEMGPDFLKGEFMLDVVFNFFAKSNVCSFILLRGSLRLDIIFLCVLFLIWSFHR